VTFRITRAVVSTDVFSHPSREISKELNSSAIQRGKERSLFFIATVCLSIETFLYKSCAAAVARIVSGSVLLAKNQRCYVKQRVDVH